MGCGGSKEASAGTSNSTKPAAAAAQAPKEMPKSTERKIQ
jgi:hypothetical protein